MKTYSKKKKKSETLQLPEKYVFKSLGVLMVQSEETVHSARVCGPGGMFQTPCCSKAILISKETRRALGICSIVDDSVLIAELINEHTENTSIVSPLLASSRWREPGQGGRTGLPGSPSAGSVVCVGPCADLAGKLNTEEDVPQPSCCLWPVVKAPRAAVNKWCLLDSSKYECPAWAGLQNLTWLKPIFGAKTSHLWSAFSWVWWASATARATRYK